MKIKGFKDFLNESIKFPTEEDEVFNYLNKNLSDITKDNWESKINDLKASWSDDDRECAIDSGSCSSWNFEISKVLSKNGIQCQTYIGEPVDDGLPEHYITICNNRVIDFVIEQFFGYGIGLDLDDANAVFSEEEYSDIKKSYTWKKIS